MNCSMLYTIRHSLINLGSLFMKNVIRKELLYKYAVIKLVFVVIYFIQTLTPLSLSKSDNEYTVLSPSPRMYVRNALSTLNYSSVCCGYVPHALLVCNTYENRKAKSPNLYFRVFCISYYPVVGGCG